MKTRLPFSFPVLDTVMHAAILGSVAIIVVMAVFSPEVVAVLT